VAGKAIRVLKRLLTPSHSDWLFLALVVWLFVVGQGWSALLADGDTGWHIRAGEFILDSGAVPRSDLFSFSKPDAPWFAWEWLSDVLFAAVWRWAALKGVVLLAGTVIATYLVVLFRHMLWRGGNVFFALAACFLASGASGIHYLARPHVFTLLLLSVSLWVIDRDRHAPGALVWLLIPLTAVWANLHAGFLALVLSLAVLAGGAAVERHWREARRYTALSAGCLGASLVNVYGIALHRHVFAYLRSDWIREAVDEFQSPKFRSETAFYFEILLFAGLAAAVCLARRRRIGEALLVVVWAHAALVSVRHVPIFAIVACPAIVSEASRWWESWVAGRAARSVPAILEGLARDFAFGARRMSLLPAFVVLGLALAGGLPGWPRDFPAAKFPSHLVNRNRETLRGRRVFTSDQWSDYLIYRFHPRQRVFVDGRSDFYGPEIGNVYLRTVYGRSDWRAALDRYAVSAVLAERRWPLADLLRDGTGWRVVDEDGIAVLFERIGAGEPPAAGQEAKGNLSVRRSMPQEPLNNEHPGNVSYKPSPERCDRR
jgi:hypothetical protein